MELTIEEAIRRGVSAHKEGKLKEAEQLYRMILDIQPKHPDANHNLGVIAAGLGEVDGALPFFKLALETNPKVEQYWLSYIDALIRLGQLDTAGQVLEQGKGVGLGREKVDALASRLSSGISIARGDHPSKEQMDGLVSLYSQGRREEVLSTGTVLATKFPGNPVIRNILGAVYSGLGRNEEAITSFNKAIELKPDYAEAHNNLGSCLQELGEYDRAVSSYKEAIRLNSDFEEAYYNLGLLLMGAGKYQDAMEQFELTSFKNSKSYLLRCLYSLNEKDRFIDLLDRFISDGHIDPLIGSLGCRSALRYGIERPNLFCKDPIEYVWQTDLRSQCDFDKIFVKAAKTIIHDRKNPRGQQTLLTNGFQTHGNLFHLQNDMTKKMQDIIHLEIAKYRNLYKESEEGLIKFWPSDYSLYAWIISMKSGGELRPHMHEKGWLSGSIYINIPEKTKADSGNLVVCIEEEHTIVNKEKGIDVHTGDLCLFPASLLHYTIPFDSEEERIVLAFDVVPK